MMPVIAVHMNKVYTCRISAQVNFERSVTRLQDFQYLAIDCEYTNAALLLVSGKLHYYPVGGRVGMQPDSINNFIPGYSGNNNQFRI